MPRPSRWKCCIWMSGGSDRWYSWCTQVYPAVSPTTSCIFITFTKWSSGYQGSETHCNLVGLQKNQNASPGCAQMDTWKIQCQQTNMLCYVMFNVCGLKPCWCIIPIPLLSLEVIWGCCSNTKLRRKIEGFLHKSGSAMNLGQVWRVAVDPVGSKMSGQNSGWPVYIQELIILSWFHRDDTLILILWSLLISQENRFTVTGFCPPFVPLQSARAARMQQ